jgi:hypothetical protein
MGKRSRSRSCSLSSAPGPENDYSSEFDEDSGTDSDSPNPYSAKHSSKWKANRPAHLSPATSVSISQIIQNARSSAAKPSSRLPAPPKKKAKLELTDRGKGKARVVDSITAEVTWGYRKSSIKSK